MAKKKNANEGWLILEDGWIPSRFFEMDQQKERDAYLSYCRRNYQGTFSYVWADMNGLRRFCKAVGI